MDEYLDDEKLLKLVNLGINSDLPFVTHALACLLQDSLDIGKTPTNKEPDALVASTSWNSGVYLYYIAFLFYVAHFKYCLSDAQIFCVTLNHSAILKLKMRSYRSLLLNKVKPV